MIKFFKNFLKDEDGAVTVDWVVLTAAVVALGVGAISAISTSTDTLAGEISDSIDENTQQGNVANYDAGA
jgi:Flp pilus assembly pilin Flp